MENESCGLMLEGACTRTVDHTLVVFIVLAASGQFEKFAQLFSVYAGIISTGNCQSYRQSIHWRLTTDKPCFNLSIILLLKLQLQPMVG